MHDLDRTQLESYGESFESFEGEYTGGEAGVLTESDEMDLATELLAVSSEEELDQFLGKVFKKVGSVVGRVARGPIGGLLKGVAKRALPFVGGALGSMIPIPGVGTAVGTALGSAAARMFEINLEAMSQEDQEFEVARRFVRLAGAAAANAAGAGPAAATPAGARTALIEAARVHAPGLVGALGAGRLNGGPGTPGAGRSGRWVRRGRHILILNA